MKLTWLGHACFLLESGGYRVIIDPCKGVRGVADTAGEADAVYCSHAHFDHCYTENVRVSGEKLSPFTVREIETFHDDNGGTQRGCNTVRAFAAEGITVVHLGDLGHQLSAEQIAAIGKCDVLLLPVGGTYTVDKDGAKAVADALNPRLICPMHYRRGEIGFEVLQTAEEFAALYPSERVRWLEDNSLMLNEDTLTQGGVIFFALPTQQEKR